MKVVALKDKQRLNEVTVSCAGGCILPPNVAVYLNDCMVVSLCPDCALKLAIDLIQSIRGSGVVICAYP